MDSGREQNYWPGFVDALSNVVLTLVFVLVIFVFALAMASNKVVKKMQEVEQSHTAQKTLKELTQQQNDQNSEEVKELKEQLAAAKAQIQKLSQQVATSASEKSQEGAVQTNAVTDQNDEKHITIEDKQSKMHQGAIDITHASNTVVLGYPLEIAEMDDKSAAQLGHVLEAMEKNVGKHKVLIRSIIGKESYSAARRLAYYRAIGARNNVMKAGENASDISMTIVQPDKPEDGRVEIVFQK